MITLEAPYRRVHGMSTAANRKCKKHGMPILNHADAYHEVRYSINERYQSTFPPQHKTYRHARAR